MSRLIDKLTRIRQNEPQPIGFAALGKPVAEKPRIQIIACMKPADLDKLSEGLNSADAALILIGNVEDVATLEKACENIKNIPIGGWYKAFNNEMLKEARAAACDYWVFPGTAPANLTQAEKIGRVLELDDALNERFIRAAGDLSIDALLISDQSEDKSLTINRLLFFQYLVNSINKPIVVAVPINLTESDLQALWDIGINGVTIELADVKSTKVLAELQKAAKNLAPPAYLKRFKASATLPRMQPEPEEPQEDGGEEEEEEP